MDPDLIRWYRDATEPDPAGVSRPSAKIEEWRGTGLCAQAQADGVPCTELGRTCDICNSAGSDQDAGSVQASGERTRP